MIHGTQKKKELCFIDTGLKASILTEMEVLLITGEASIEMLSADLSRSARC
jgi:hypothetical protein